MRYRIGQRIYICPTLLRPLLAYAHTLPVGKVRSALVTVVFRFSSVA